MKQKNVLITGGSRGIGAAAVKAFSEKGYKVCFLYNKEVEKAEKVAKENNAIQLKCDVSDGEQVRASIRKAEALMGIEGFDIVICNAAISKIQLFDMMDTEDWKKIIDVNINGVYYVIKNVLPKMIWNKQGTIITVASMWGQVGASCEVAYSTTKAAIIGMTKSLAKEVASSGINVNCVSPGVIDTDMNCNLTTQDLEELKNEIPLGRLGTPKNIADTMVFLASDEAKYITGQVIGVNGGMVI